MNQPQASPPAPSRPELLAPGGEPEAAYAALHYGADAVYVGLHQFSARAEAVNFAPEELEELTAYAHSLTPARRIFVTVKHLEPQRDWMNCGCDGRGWTIWGGCLIFRIWAYTGRPPLFFRASPCTPAPDGHPQSGGCAATQGHGFQARGRWRAN
jgi:hypothetical protein